MNTSTHEQRTLHAEVVVNAAGLWAQQIAKSFEGLPSDSIPKLHVARGCYFELSGAYQCQSCLPGLL